MGKARVLEVGKARNTVEEAPTNANAPLMTGQLAVGADVDLVLHDLLRQGTATAVAFQTVFHLGRDGSTCRRRLLLLHLLQLPQYVAA